MRGRRKKANVDRVVSIERAPLPTPAKGVDYETLLRALTEHAAKQGIHTVLSSAFASQRDVILDPSRWKAVLASRRSGKSYAAGIYLYYVALNNPGCNCLYVSLNHQSSKAIMFKDIMIPIAEQHRIRIKVNWNELTIQLENGSVIRFLGLDANPNVSNNLLGGKYKLVVFDECASFKYDLEDIINRKLRAALADERGTVLLIGTPDNIFEDNFFYQVTRPDPENRTEKWQRKTANWKNYVWSALDNPYMRQQFMEEMDEQRRLNPDADNDPAFQQMYLGKWTNAALAQVYAYCTAQSLVAKTGKDVDFGRDGNLPQRDLPSATKEEEQWVYVMAVDFGWNDPSALVVGAFNKYDPVLYIVDCFKQNHLTASEFGTVIKEFQDRYKVARTWADPAHKQMLHDINSRLGLHLLPANKTDKNGQISLVNFSFRLGQIRLHEGAQLDPLRKELKELVWDQKAFLRDGSWVEHPRCDNHLTDSLLYLYRESRHHRAVARPVVNAVEKDSPEYYARLRRQRRADIIAQNQKPWYRRRW